MRIPSPIARHRARIEIIPLIDIMFFLLATFVMVSLSMVKNKGIPVRLPVASSSAPQERKSSVVASVTQSGQIYLDKDPMTLEALSSKLALLKKSDPDLRVFIRGDDGAPFGVVARVLDKVRLLGIKAVAIETVDARED